MFPELTVAPGRFAALIVIGAAAVPLRVMVKPEYVPFPMTIWSPGLTLPSALFSSVLLLTLMVAAGAASVAPRVRTIPRIQIGRRQGETCDFIWFFFPEPFREGGCAVGVSNHNGSREVTRPFGGYGGMLMGR